MINTLREQLKNKEESINMKIGIKTSIQKDINDKSEKINQLDKEVKILEKVSKTFQSIADLKRSTIKNKVENLVTHGLRIVYDNSYRFELEFEVKRDDITVQPYVCNEIGNKTIKTKVLDARGGGIVDVVSFLNRLITLSFKKKELRQVLFIDEAFKNVGSGNIDKVSQLLKWSSNALNIQFIVVTHKSELIDAADKVFHVKRVEGVSIVKEKTIK